MTSIIYVYKLSWKIDPIGTARSCPMSSEIYAVQIRVFAQVVDVPLVTLILLISLVPPNRSKHKSMVLNIYAAQYWQLTGLTLGALKPLLDSSQAYT